mmetsp:Transcript_8896/g.22780  ORF Transcript_8896/g.22780 Transcript_8896/m.22780 type:complete len:251 (+) Transcript_8896:86-838(+)
MLAATAGRRLPRLATAAVPRLALGARASLLRTAPQGIFPTSMDDVRELTTEELEHARLNLLRALENPDIRDEALRRRTTRLLGGTLLRLGSTTEAERHLDDALSMEEALVGDPRETDEGLEVIFMLGVVYQRSGRERDAVEAFEAVVGADEHHWRSRFHLATIAITSGGHEEGQELLEQVLEDEPGHEQTLQILAKLAELRQVHREDAEAVGEAGDDLARAQAEEHPGSVSDWKVQRIKLGPDGNPAEKP